MAHNQLSKKLDIITDVDLDVDFDGTAVWSRLEDRLDGRKRIVYWWTVAASVIILVLFLPVSVLKETKTQTLRAPELIDLPMDQYTSNVSEEGVKNVRKEFVEPHKTLKKRGIEELGLAQVLPTQLVLKPIKNSNNNIKKAAFAAEDISVIQASLERPKIGKGRTMTIRAQWQKSPTKSNVEHQALKIKLYGKDK